MPHTDCGWLFQGVKCIIGEKEPIFYKLIWKGFCEVARRSRMILLLNFGCILQFLPSYLLTPVTTNIVLFSYDPSVSLSFFPTSQWGVWWGIPQGLKHEALHRWGCPCGMGGGVTMAGEGHVGGGAGTSQTRKTQNQFKWASPVLSSLMQETICLLVTSCLLCTWILEFAGKVGVTVGKRQGINSTGIGDQVWKHLIYLT